MSRLDDSPSGTGSAWLLPRGAVTGIGSLPTSDLREAIEFVAAHAPLLPFCPQPPTTDLVADTLDQQLAPPSPAGGRWLQEFADAAIGGAFPRALALKSQLTGPITLAGLLSAAGHADFGDELLRRLAELVSRRAAWHRQVLEPAGLPVLIVVDEPAAVLLDSEHSDPQELPGALLRRIRQTGPGVGIHCCSITEPRRLSSYDCDFLSYDASGSTSLDHEDAEVLGDGTKVIAFGLIGAGQPPEAPSVAFSRWLAAASLVENPLSLAARTIVTTRCGLGRSTMAEAEAAFGAASAVSALVGKVAQMQSGLRTTAS